MADGFKNTTRTQYFKGGESGTKGAAKVAKVMGDFKKGAPVKKAMGGPILPTQANSAAAAGVARRPAMPAQADNARRVTTMQKGGRMPVESTSARPVKIGQTAQEVAEANAVARGNRMQALEAAEEAKLLRERPVTPVRGGGTQNRALGRGAAADGPVMKPINRAMGGPASLPSQANSRATEALAARKTAPTLPSQANSRATEALAARKTAPTLPSQANSRAGEAIARKKGGLAVMPRGKKC